MQFFKSLFGNSEQDPKKPQEQTDEDIVVIPGDEEYSLEVVGESFYQANIEKISGERKERGKYLEKIARLILENENPKDKNAVRVEIDSLPVGYLSKEVAKIYRTLIKNAGHPNATGECKAVIKGGWKRKNGDVGSYGVWLDIPVEK